MIETAQKMYELKSEYDSRYDRESFFDENPNASEQDWSEYFDYTCAIGRLLSRSISVTLEQISDRYQQIIIRGMAGFYEKQLLEMGFIYCQKRQVFYKTEGFRQFDETDLKRYRKTVSLLG